MLFCSVPVPRAKSEDSGTAAPHAPPHSCSVPRAKPEDSGGSTTTYRRYRR
ncbi:MAG: hypothetical protein J6X55_08460 [Victivallales bacterium]|nr:hypothetical protein [Victivallales bacterium]